MVGLLLVLLFWVHAQHGLLLLQAAQGSSWHPQRACAGPVRAQGRKQFGAGLDISMGPQPEA